MTAWKRSKKGEEGAEDGVYEMFIVIVMKLDIICVYYLPDQSKPLKKESHDSEI